MWGTNKLLFYKAEIIVMPKWNQLIKDWEKQPKYKDDFKNIKANLGRKFDIKFGKSPFINELTIEKGIEKISNSFIAKGGARFILMQGLVWSDLQKTFFTDLGFNEQIFGGYGGPEPFLWMDLTKPHFTVGGKRVPTNEWELGELKNEDLEKLKSEKPKLEKGGMLRFSWGGPLKHPWEGKEICKFPLNSIRAFSTISGKEVLSPNLSEDISKSGFSFSTDLGYEIYENDYFTIKFKDIVKL